MLTNRWAVLALLFSVRCTMGLQFQSVPALSPLFLSNFALSLADFGLLIGLYHAPGVALALPGGAIGQHFGEKRVVATGLALMAAGGVLMASATSFELQVAGRLLSGVGGILMNVVMTKMVADWFAGKEIATAMGIFVNSWPFGVAIGLMLLPPVAKAEGLTLTLLTVSVIIVIALMAFILLYAGPHKLDATPQATAAKSAWPQGYVLSAVLCSGVIWGLYNASLAMIFGFGPALLGERGMLMVDASATTSIVLWLVAVSVPMGGIIADRSARPYAVMIIGFLGFAILLAVAARSTTVLLPFVLLGFISGLPAGAIMSLPARVLKPETRAVGMGLFFTVFYALQLLAPAIAGALSKQAGSVIAAFDFGCIMLLSCCVALLIFSQLAAQVLRPTASKLV